MHKCFHVGERARCIEMVDKEVYCAFDHTDSFPRNAPSRHCGTLQCKRTNIRNEYGDPNRLVIRG